MNPNDNKIVPYEHYSYLEYLETPEERCIRYLRRGNKPPVLYHKNKYYSADIFTVLNNAGWTPSEWMNYNG